MTSKNTDISDGYRLLSSLYKNPTRSPEALYVDGVAATNVDHELFRRHAGLFTLFEKQHQILFRTRRDLYYKILALLYEIEDYRGALFLSFDLQAENRLPLIEQFAQKPDSDGNRPFERTNFKNEANRSLAKAMIRYCVAAIESRRREDDLHSLSDELDIIESFIRNNLHFPDDEKKLPAWTTLALVHSAQARLARQSQDYDESREKLLAEMDCLNRRADEILDVIALLKHAETPNEEKLTKIEDLKDDLVFIRRKQTLSSLFNVALVAFQRGFLTAANHACQAARLQFRSHGQHFQEVFNDLVILAIKRARTSTYDRDSFLELKHHLDRVILPDLDPEIGIGNPKLYLYAMRELAVLQYYCEQPDEMQETLNRMEGLRVLTDQWRSRIHNQRARSFWRTWVRESGEANFEHALNHSQQAFSFASGLHQTISNYRNSDALRVAIERSVKASLIDTIEALITYGSIHASARNSTEAIKAADAVIELAGNNNPRLRAMGFLIRAEVNNEDSQVIAAQNDLAQARLLEKRIDHRYVSDRRKAIERRLPRDLPLADLKEVDDPKKRFKVARYRLIGWLVETYSEKQNPNEVARKIGVNRSVIDAYLEFLSHPENESEPFHHHLEIVGRHERERKVKRSKSDSDVSGEA